MCAVDPAGEWRELAERYHQMKDEELVILARQKSSMTEVAQQALTQEIAFRRLEVPPVEAPAPPEREPNPDDPYAEERELVELCKVWSPRDAFQVQTLLDRASIPFFIGPEKATDVSAITSNFVDGVSVQVMRVGLYWAGEAMKKYTPFDAPAEEPREELEELPVRCPKCRSTDVVVERLVSEAASAKDDSPPKFEWTCDACGYEWEDDGIVRQQ
jgi:hypothetical protein